MLLIAILSILIDENAIRRDELMEQNEMQIIHLYHVVVITLHLYGLVHVLSQDFFIKAMSNVELVLLVVSNHQSSQTI